MEHMFLLLSLVSSSLCIGSNSHLGTGTSMAVCQPDTCTMLSEVAAMREKLAAMTHTQSTLEQNLSAMMQKMSTVGAELQSYKSQVEELQRANQDQAEQLKALAAVTFANTSRVAFSAALGDSVGPFQENMPLKYQKIISNIGSGYNPATGIFTARVRGVYYFRYTMYNNNAGEPNSVLALMMNSQPMVFTWDTTGSDNNDSASNAVVLQLDAGDSVYVRLWAKRQVYDDGGNYNTFSGFLLFTV